MRVQVWFADEGKDKAEMGLPFEFPALPRVGDRIQVLVKGDSGSIDGVVRLVRWFLTSTEDRPSYTDSDARVGAVENIEIVCDAVISPFSSEEHRQTFPNARKML